MKYTIEGFSQEYAMKLKKHIEKRNKIVEIKIDCTDLVILRWFVDFYPKMKKYIIDNKEYAWLTHNKLLEDLPLIDISRGAFIERMQKLVEFGILEYRFVKKGGTYSLYAFGENYNNLIESKEGEGSNNDGVQGQTDTGVGVQSSTGVYGQTDTKDNTINNISINNNIYTEIINYLNQKAGTHYRQVESNYRNIKARLNEFTVNDLKEVIDKKTAEWLGTEFEKYLNPETLFRQRNFEKYLNQKPPSKKTKENLNYLFDNIEEMNL